MKCWHREKFEFRFGTGRDDKHFWCWKCGAFRDCRNHGKWLESSISSISG